MLYNRDQRFAGDTKYPLRKMIRFALDALTGFSSAPLKLASHAGLWLSVGSVLVMLYIFAGWLSGRAIPGWTSLMLIVVVIGAVQMFVLGLMGEYIGRLYSQAKQRPLYIVQEIAGRDGDNPDHGLGIVASAKGPVAVKPKGHQRRQRKVGDDRPPRRARKTFDQ